MALRFSQPWTRGLRTSAALSRVSINGGTNNGLALLEELAYVFAPGKYSELREVEFWVHMTGGATTIPQSQNYRLRLMAVSDPADSLDLATVSIAGSDLAEGGTLGGIFNVSANTISDDQLFSRSSEFQELVDPTTGNSYVNLRLTFDRFDASDSAEFFEQILAITDPDVYVGIQLVLESNATIPSANPGFIAGYGMNFKQAPSANNRTVALVPLGRPGLDGGINSTFSGTNFDATGDNLRGQWQFRYVADDWDGIDSVRIFGMGGSGSNSGDITVRAQRITDAQAYTTENLIEESQSLTGGGQQAILRTQDFKDSLTDGDALVVDFRHTQAPTGLGNWNWEFWLEVTQSNATKSVAVYYAHMDNTRNRDLAQTRNLPFSSFNIVPIDPLYFEDYPDSLFRRRYAYTSLTYNDAAGANVGQSILLQSVSAQDTFLYNDPDGGVTPFTTEIDQVLRTDDGGWRYGEVPIGPGTGRIDPIAVLGARYVHVRAESTEGANDDTQNCHSGAGIAYAVTLPESDVLELGPLFPLSPFVSDGCQSTAAGGGENPGVLVLANGSGRSRKFNPADGSITFLGIDAPFRGEQPSAVATDDAQSPDGSLSLGLYQYRYTFKNSATQHESNPSPENFEVDTALQSPRARVELSFANVRIPGDPQIDTICIYRGAVDVTEPALFRKVGEIDIDSTTTFIDQVGDERFDDIGDDALPALSFLNGVPPCTPIVVEFRNRIFALGNLPQLSPEGTVTVTDGSREVTGDFDVLWDSCLLGQFIQVQGDPRAYEIDEILPPTVGTSPEVLRLRLTEPYEGTSGTGLNYIIFGRPNRVWVSEPFQPEAFPESLFLDIEPGDGDRIQGAISNYDSLLICKRNKSYVLRFNLNPVTEVNVPSRISSDIGCIAPRSFAQVNVGSVFLADRGLALFDGRSVSHIPASDRANDIFVNPANPRYVVRDRTGRVPQAIGEFYPKREQYLLLVPTASATRGGCNLMVVWDTAIDNFTLLEFAQEFTAMTVAKDDDGNERVYLGDVNGFVWIFDSGFTDGAGYENATGTVRGFVTASGLDSTGASFLEDSGASFIQGGVPGLAGISGTSGLSGFTGANNMGLAGVALFTRPANSPLDTPWTERFIYASSRTRLYVTPGWGEDTPSVGDEYMVGAIDFLAEFKPTTMQADDILKRHWKSVVIYAPETRPSKLRIELLPDFATKDPNEDGIIADDGNVSGRVFNLSRAGGRADHPNAREIFQYLQTRLSNFAPDEPVRIFNHILRISPKEQQG